MMPEVHESYSILRDKFGNDIKILFPTWMRTPFSIAAALRGMQNLLIDMITDTPFVHDLMRFLVDSEKKWLTERAKFLNENKIVVQMLSDNEVGAPMISPRLYEELILPYEIEIVEFLGV